MKNFLLIFILSFSLLACKPESMVVQGETLKTDEITKDQSTMQQKEHIAEVRLTVPDSTWSVKIINVTQTEGEIAVVCQLIKSDMMGMMVISEVIDAVKFTANVLPIKYYIKGKTWNWENSEGYTFMDADSKVLIRNGETIAFERTEPSAKGGPKKQPLGSPL